jgi:CheY-like chemotaxis protein
MSHVLLIYENPNAIDVPAIICDDAGYSIECVPQREAIARVGRGEADVVVMTCPVDPTLARTLRAANRAVPMLAILPDAGIEGIQAMRGLGIDLLLPRPLSVQSLRRALTTLLARPARASGTGEIYEEAAR